MIFRKIAIAVACVAATLTSVSAFAQAKDARHTMPSGPDVWRIELRNYNQFFSAGEVADRDLREEIHSMKVTLENQFSTAGRNSDYQFHSVQEWGIDMTSTFGVGNRSYVVRRSGDVVSWNRQPRHGNNLWIHTKQYVEEQGGKPLIFFAITVSVRELDCLRKRVCDRGNNGKLTYLFKLPIPTERSSSCIPQNTFKLNGRSQIIGGVRSGNVTLTSMTNRNDVRNVPFAIARAKPELFIKSAEICIASTSG